jgi:ABC-2 type transport system permease protein
MSRTLRSEWLKMRSTRILAGMAAALVATVTLACVVHLLGFGPSRVDERSEQLGIMFDVGITVGLVFALIAGAVSITGEFRYRTIQSVLLKEPHRRRVLDAKSVTQLVIGPAFAITGIGTALVCGVAILNARAIGVKLTVADSVRLLTGAGFGGLMFALIGLALGTVVRSQVPVVVGALLWTLMIESLLRAGVPTLARFTPGSLARRVAGESANTSTLSWPTAALALAAATVTCVLGAREAFARCDIH